MGCPTNIDKSLTWDQHIIILCVSRSSAHLSVSEGSGRYAWGFDFLPCRRSCAALVSAKDLHVYYHVDQRNNTLAQSWFIDLHRRIKECNVTTEWLGSDGTTLDHGLLQLVSGQQLSTDPHTPSYSFLALVMAIQTFTSYADLENYIKNAI